VAKEDEATAKIIFHVNFLNKIGLGAKKSRVITK